MAAHPVLRRSIGAEARAARDAHFRQQHAEAYGADSDSDDADDAATLLFEAYDADNAADVADDTNFVVADDAPLLYDDCSSLVLPSDDEDDEPIAAPARRSRRRPVPTAAASTLLNLRFTRRARPDSDDAEPVRKRRGQYAPSPPAEDDSSSDYQASSDAEASSDEEASSDDQASSDYQASSDEEASSDDEDSSDDADIVADVLPAPGRANGATTNATWVHVDTKFPGWRQLNHRTVEQQAELQALLDKGLGRSDPVLLAQLKPHHFDWLVNPHDRSQQVWVTVLGVHERVPGLGTWAAPRHNQERRCAITVSAGFAWRPSVRDCYAMSFVQAQLGSLRPGDVWSGAAGLLPGQLVRANITYANAATDSHKYAAPRWFPRDHAGPTTVVPAHDAWVYEP
jgi:hypothetical protein